MSVTVKDISYDGFVTFWCISGYIKHNELYKAMESCGLEKLCPNQMSNFTTLYSALYEIVIDPQLLLRSLDKQRGWCVVCEEKNTEQNEYSTKLTALVNEATGELTFNGGDAEMHTYIRDYFNGLRGTVHRMQLSHTLARVVEHLNGIPLRARGGVYWLPSNALTTWDRLSNAIRSGDPNGKPANEVFMIRHKFDPDSITAVQTAISNNLLSDVDEIYRDVVSGAEKSERQLKSRRAAIDQVKAKANAIAQSSGLPLDAVKLAIDKLELAEATSVLVD